jgi:hypothetical protein
MFKVGDLVIVLDDNFALTPKGCVMQFVKETNCSPNILIFQSLSGRRRALFHWEVCPMTCLSKILWAKEIQESKGDV